MDVTLGAAEIARRIAAGELTSLEATNAFIARIEEVNPALNAVVVPLFESALAEAKACDAKQQSGEALPPLHGVPVTIKECFAVKDTPSTIGLTTRRNKIDAEDSLLVKRLREAGCVLLGKTNVPQLMIWHEADNPVYGRTNHPYDLERSPGGSSGGEGAIIGAGGSPLGLGSDLGGSIRLPCHWCGVVGIKPTSLRLSRGSSVATLRGMDTIHYQPGPMGRSVEDVWLGLQALVGDPLLNTEPDVTTAPLRDPADVDVTSLRIAYWTDDGEFPASTGIVRAVETAADALRKLGAQVERFTPPNIDEMMRLYFGLLGADAGADAKQIAKGSEVDSRVARLMKIAGMPNRLRGIIGKTLRWQGQVRQAELVSGVRRLTATEYWQRTYEKQLYVERFMAELRSGGFDAMLCPPHALPAQPHGIGIEMLAPASYAFLMNLLETPAGVVPWAVVQAGEESTRPKSRDKIDALARKTDKDSAGLPVGVQVAAPHWREDIVLAVMSALEKARRELTEKQVEGIFPGGVGMR